MNLRVLSYLLAAALPLTALANELPVVRTADLQSLLQGATPGVRVTYPAVASAAPVASINADNVEWRGEEGKEMARIAALNPVDISTNGKTEGSALRAVLRIVCDEAGMKYYIAESPVMDSPVTMSGIRHPWEILKTLARMYNLEMVYRNNNWDIYAKDDGEVFGKAYVLRHNALEKFSSGGGASSSSSGGNSNAGASSNTSGAGAQGGSSSAVSLDRSGQSIMTLNSEAIVKEVEKFLSLQTRRGAIAGADGDLGLPGPRAADAAAVPTARKGLVNFISESNTLYVVATAAQHDMLQNWLSMIDRPQRLIHVESKFFLTTVNPKRNAGVNSSLLKQDGLGLKLSKMSTEVDLARPGAWKFPSAILDATDLSASLSFLQKDSDTMTVQYPQQTTLSGHEVVIRSVRQVPIVSNTNSSTVGTGVNTNSQVQFVDVGTIVSILPKVMDDRNVMMAISITVSSITDQVMINGNLTPVVTSQNYNNQVIVESGYSLALGGLEQTLQTSQSTKVPLLGDIPFFGFAFKDTQRERSRSVLTMIVTPTVLDGYSGGNTSGIAQYTLPARGTAPRVVFDGRATATADDVQLSLRGFGRDVEEVVTIAREGRGDARSRRRADLLLNELDLMDLTLRQERAHGRAAKSLEADIQDHRARIAAALPRLPNSVSMTN